jgi:hypothetical protein
LCSTNVNIEHAVLGGRDELASEAVSDAEALSVSSKEPIATEAVGGDGFGTRSNRNAQSEHLPLSGRVGDLAERILFD